MKASEKFRYVMREFKNKELIGGGLGDIVTDRNQALAIAFSEAKKIDSSYGKYKDGGSLDFSDLYGKDVGEMSYLAEKGYKRTKNVMFQYPNSMEGIEASEGAKIKNGQLEGVGISYFVGLEDVGGKFPEELVLSKDMLDVISDSFRNNTPIILFTNAGVDLHTKYKGKYKNITVKRISVKFSTGGEIRTKYRADEYFPMGDGYEFMFDNEEVANKMASDYGADVIADGESFYVPVAKDKMAEGGDVESFKYDPEIDYLERYELLPLFVREIILSDEFEEPSYSDNEIVLEKLKPLGWTFEYGLDSMPYSLRPIGEPEQEFDMFSDGGTVDGYDVDEVLKHFIMAMLWSSTDDEGEPLEDSHKQEDVASESISDIKSGIIKFIKANQQILKQHSISSEALGHDLFLDSQGHGVGFWDRDYGADGDLLSASSKKYFSGDTYVGDDGDVYFQMNTSSKEAFADGGTVNEEKTFIRYMNKDKGFKEDKKHFNSYKDAVKWGRKELGNFNLDMVEYEHISGVLDITDLEKRLKVVKILAKTNPLMRVRVKIIEKMMEESKISSLSKIIESSPNIQIVSIPKPKHELTLVREDMKVVGEKEHPVTVWKDNDGVEYIKAGKSEGIKQASISNLVLAGFSNLSDSDKLKLKSNIPILELEDVDYFVQATKLAAMVTEALKKDSSYSSHWKLHETNATMKAIPLKTKRQKYIKMNSGSSGVFMVDVTDGGIYGIKGYGKINKAHKYGNIADYMNGKRSVQPQSTYKPLERSHTIIPLTETPKPKESNSSSKDVMDAKLKPFVLIARESKTVEEFMDNTRKIKGVTSEVAKYWREKYQDNPRDSINKVADNFFKEVKHGASGRYN